MLLATAEPRVGLAQGPPGGALAHRHRANAATPQQRPHAHVDRASGAAGRRRSRSTRRPLAQLRPTAHAPSRRRGAPTGGRARSRRSSGRRRRPCRRGARARCLLRAAPSAAAAGRPRMACRGARAGARRRRARRRLPRDRWPGARRFARGRGPRERSATGGCCSRRRSRAGACGSGRRAAASARRRALERLGSAPPATHAAAAAAERRHARGRGAVGARGAAILPWVVRGRSAARRHRCRDDLVGRAASAPSDWSTAASARTRRPSPRGAVLGAILGGALAVCARALRGPVSRPFRIEGRVT